MVLLIEGRPKNSFGEKNFCFGLERKKFSSVESNESFFKTFSLNPALTFPLLASCFMTSQHLA
jgi:hypothetical protein